MKDNITLYLITSCCTIALAILFFILSLNATARTIYAELVALSIGISVFNFSVYNKLKREKELNLED
jgi:hypothetical protein